MVAYGKEQVANKWQVFGLKLTSRNVVVAWLSQAAEKDEKTHFRFWLHWPGNSMNSGPINPYPCLLGEQTAAKPERGQ